MFIFINLENNRNRSSNNFILFSSVTKSWNFHWQISWTLSGLSSAYSHPSRSSYSRHTQSHTLSNNKSWCETTFLLRQQVENDSINSQNVSSVLSAITVLSGQFLWEHIQWLFNIELVSCCGSLPVRLYAEVIIVQYNYCHCTCHKHRATEFKQNGL